MKVWEFTSTRPVIGLDEVGMGPIAGPIAAVALVLREDADMEALAEVDDSKKVRESKRTTLAPIIRDNTVWFCGWASPLTIDTIGHKEAHQKALIIALEGILEMLKGKDYLLVLDGNQPLKGSKIDQINLVKGDSKCLEVAAASVVAKHLRDEHMRTLSRQFPLYRWHLNKGYPTEEHIGQVHRYGLTPHHRVRACENALLKWRTRHGK